MADEQYRWLDRETAERLLSGEPPEAVGGAAREQAEQLARTLDALSAPPPATSEELPGEAAALAAFRKARAEREDAGAATGGHTRAGTSDAGLVRIGAPRGSGSGDVLRPRWARPARLALAAALAVGMVGGVAVAAGTGVLRAPFGSDEPDPGASVSADATAPERPPRSPSPSDAVQGGSSPGGSPGGASSGGTGGSGRDGARGDTTPKPGHGDRGDRPGHSHREIASACRDLRDGKRLGADRKRALRDAARGSRVWTYCQGVLSAADARSGQRHPEDRRAGGREGEAGQQDRKRDEDNHENGDEKQDRKKDEQKDEGESQSGRQSGREPEERAGKKGDDAGDRDRTRPQLALSPL